MLILQSTMLKISRVGGEGCENRDCREGPHNVGIVPR